MWLKLVAVFVVCGVLVRCELERRDVHRIILKPERSKKIHKKHHHPSKNHHKPHHHDHRDSDYEPQALSSNYYSEETSFYLDNPKHKPHHKYHNHHEEYHELTRPRPPHRENNYFAYPEEDKFPSKHFRKDIKEIWNPLPSQTNSVTRKPPPTFDYPQQQQQNHGKKPRRKSTPSPPSLSQIIDITTDKPRKYPLPLLTANQFEPQKPINQKPRITPESLIPKDFEMGGIGLDHSYEVHEDFFEQKTTKPPPASFVNVSPLMGSYLNNLKTPQPFLPTTVPFISAGMYNNNGGDFGLRTRNLQKPF